MTPAHLARLNARNRMSDAERKQDIVNEIFGPSFNAFFGAAKPQTPVPLPDCDGCRETLDGQVICCQEAP